MRVPAVSVLMFTALPAAAQPVGMIGPRLMIGDVRAERFDVVFHANVCTMVANIAKLAISTVDAAKPSMAKVFLRAHPALR